MVDGTATFGRDVPADGAARPRPAHGVQVAPADAETLAAYDRFCADARFAPAQDPVWVRSFAREDRQAMVVTLSQRSQPVLALPLEIVRQGPFRVARFVGGGHANGNFPALRPGAAVERPTLDGIAASLRSAHLGVDALLLERQAETLFGLQNPLFALPHSPSPNIALAIDLAGGFDAVLARLSGKRKRKKHRAQSRKFEAAGGYRRFQAATMDEVDRVLDTFFAMKSARFRKMGVDDVFAADDIRTSLRTLFTAALDDARPRFVLHVLEVGGEIRAVSGCSIAGDRIVCDFGAITEDELAASSPGEFLSFDNIREACETGFAVFDFSVGDEPYKRLWCDVEQTQFDVFLPLTAKGRLLVATLRGVASIKRRIKASPALWSIAKRVRKARARQEPAVVADED